MQCVSQLHGKAKKMFNELRLCRQLIQALVNLVVPHQCRICGSRTGLDASGAVCGACLAAVDNLGDTVCRKCGTAMRSMIAAGMVCGECIRRPPPWNRASSLVRYSPEIRHLLLALKYQGDTTVLPALTTLAGPTLAGMVQDWDLILPVPLHKKRLQQRGMNQALVLARALFPENRRRIDPGLLVRGRATRPQTGLDGRQRRRNLKGAFHVLIPEIVQGKKILLIDDVFTTGTTVAECSRVLRRSGAAEIEVFTYARVVLDSRR